MLLVVFHFIFILLKNVQVVQHCLEVALHHILQRPEFLGLSEKESGIFLCIYDRESMDPQSF